MKRSSILWLVVAIGAGGAMAIRIVHPRIARTLLPGPGTRPVVKMPPVPRDYVANPVVDPAERDNGPASIVSMAPSITETCCALGLLDRLVGRTQYCVNPPAVRKVRDVGALVDPNLEIIASLKPEVIFISKNAPRLGERFTQLKFPFEEITDDSFAGVFTGIERIGTLTNRRQTAATLIGNLQRDLAAIDMAAGTRQPRRVLIAIGELPVPPQPIFVAGPGLFLSDLLVRLGHVNAAAAVVQTKSGELSLEQVVTLNPDVILEVRPNRARDTEGFYKAWSQIGPIRAIQDRAVRSYGTYDDLVCSPRINIVYYQLATALAEWQ